MLLYLLAARFGEVPAEMLARVEAADQGVLERWAVRVLTAKTPEDDPRVAVHDPKGVEAPEIGLLDVDVDAAAIAVHGVPDQLGHGE
jgi:hypothetical protein